MLKSYQSYHQILSFVIFIIMAPGNIAYGCSQEIFHGDPFDAHRYSYYIPNCDDSNSLHLAAAQGNTERMKQFLENNPFTVHSLRLFSTPLEYAVDSNQIKSISLLLGYNANPCCVSTQAINNPKLLQTILTFKQNLYLGIFKNKVLLNLVQEKNSDLIPLLLSEGADPNTVNPASGAPLLHIAIEKKSLVIVQQLMTAGANPYTPDRLGNMALHKAAEVGSAELVAFFLEYTQSIPDNNYSN